MQKAATTEMLLSFIRGIIRIDKGWAHINPSTVIISIKEDE